MHDPASTAIRDLLENGARNDAAFGAPGRPDLAYDGLRAVVDCIGAALDAFGVSPGDRVAIVLPNGPAMAACFLAVASHATAAPLDPDYREDEFDFYIADLRAKLLIVARGMDTPARTAAARHGVPVVDLVETEDDPAGLFALDLAGRAPGTARRAGPGDIALVMYTSGSASRPKGVPLTGSNLAASARHIAATLQLSPADRCLNIMPPFHVHGLVAAVLASMQAGASVHCTSGPDALRAFRRLEAARPTWYTAEPTMQQAILARAGRNIRTVAAMKLRLVRSSSSALAPRVMRELEEALESYGMAEESHQAASNRLPSGFRHPGSVGVAAGPEGEIVIHGPTVTTG